MSIATRLQSGTTACTKIDNALHDFDFYDKYLLTRIDQAKYLESLLEHEEQLKSAGLNAEEIHLSTRIPLSSEKLIDKILKNLNESNVIPTYAYPKNVFDIFYLKAAAHFEHADNTTYIFPEEARLLFALTHITQPKTMIFIGSYYGYWAIWALAILKAYGGKAYLIDTDKNALDLAKFNMKKLGFDPLVHYINEDAVEFMNREKIPHDFMVIVPESPKIGSDTDLLDKTIYYPVIKATDPYLNQNGIILCHNMLLTHSIKDEYFEKKIAQNYQQLEKFLPYMKENYEVNSWYETTEGVGIFAGKK